MDDWRTIDSAPKDGTVVLLWGGAPNWYGSDEFDADDQWEKPRAVSAWWDDAPGEWRFCSYDSGHYGIYSNPRQWMPEPRPPLPTDRG